MANVKGYTRRDGTKVKGYTRKATGTRRTSASSTRRPGKKKSSWRTMLKNMGAKLRRRRPSRTRIKTEGGGYVTV